MQPCREAGVDDALRHGGCDERRNAAVQQLTQHAYNEKGRYKIRMG